MTINEGATGEQVLRVEFPDDIDLDDFELVEEHKPYREWCVPAALINEHATVTLMSEDDLDEISRARWEERFRRDNRTDRGELPDRPLVAQIPISTHHEGSEIGNQISSMTVSLATDVADPAQRMKTTYGNSQGATEMTKALTAHQLRAPLAA